LWFPGECRTDNAWLVKSDSEELRGADFKPFRPPAPAPWRYWQGGLPLSGGALRVFDLVGQHAASAQQFFPPVVQQLHGVVVVGVETRTEEIQIMRQQLREQTFRTPQAPEAFQVAFDIEQLTGPAQHTGVTDTDHCEEKQGDHQ